MNKYLEMSATVDLQKYLMKLKIAALPSKTPEEVENIYVSLKPL